MTKNPIKIVVAMSGGVDSSVAAALLTDQGYDVVGVMMQLWSDRHTENMCCTPVSMELAHDVATNLGIPFYTIDAKLKFRNSVVQYFIDSYKSGETPNPCVVCNRWMRWNTVLNKADELGATYIATGHYARNHRDDQGKVQLLKGVDKNKDQSYVLHGLSQEQLTRTLFPLGKFTKPEIREIAHRFELPVAERPDSQDLCFVGNGDYRDFLVRHAPDVIDPGPIVNSEGEDLGQHRGLAFYTIGQRKGLGIAVGNPYFVIEKDLPRNALVVGTSAELGQDELQAADVNWITGETPKKPFRAMVKIRYKARDIGGTISPLNDHRVHVKFDETIRDITPGQSVVFYNGEVA